MAMIRQLFTRTGNSFYFPSLAVYSLLTAAGLMTIPIPTVAAEKVILKYSILRESISVAELRELANTGKASPTLKAYLRLANKKPEELQRLLSQKVDVDPVLLSKVLNSFAGEYILDRTSSIIHTPSSNADRQALRGAIINSAVPDGNFRLIEVLENYPTSEVHIEGDRLRELYSQLQRIVDKLPQFPL